MTNILHIRFVLYTDCRSLNKQEQPCERLRDDEMSRDIAHIVQGKYQLSDSSELSLNLISTDHMFLGPDCWKLSLV